MASWKNIPVLAAGLLAFCQCLPVQRLPRAQNRPGSSAHSLTTGDPEVAAILARSCGDCHSSHAALPWYGHVAPASWLVASHVDRGIRKWDLAVWDTRKPLRGEMEDICDSVSDRSMPLRSYTWMHPKARLNDREIDKLCAWADSLSSSTAR